LTVDPPPVLPQCSDLSDNDGDGFFDFVGGDPDCTDALDDNEGFSITIDAQPSITVRSGDTVDLVWNTTNIISGTCTIVGSNGQNFGTVADTGSGLMTNILTNAAVFTLQCTDRDGNPVSASVTVTVLPDFGEF